MPKIGKCYGIGQGLLDLMPPPIGFENPPTSNQDNYSIGQIVYTPIHNPTAFYIYRGGGVWVEFVTSGGDIFSIIGTAPIAASTVAGVSTISMTGPANVNTLTAHGVVIGEGTSPMAATAVGATGQVLIGSTGADPAFDALGVNSGLTAHGVLLGEGNSAIAATAVGATGTLFSGNTGADPTFTASPSVTGSVTAGTGFVATTGNVAISAVGSGLLLTPTVASGSSAGTVAADGRVVSVTFTSVSIAGGATQAFTTSNTAITGSGTVLHISMVGATSGAGLNIQSVANTAGQSVITVENTTLATTSTADITFTYFVLN